MEYIMLMFLSLGANLIKKIWGAKQMFSKISEDCKTIKCVGKLWHVNIENEWQVLAMSYMWNDGSWTINKVLFVDFFRSTRTLLYLWFFCTESTS